MEKEQLLEKIDKEEQKNNSIFMKWQHEYSYFCDAFHADSVESLLSSIYMEPMKSVYLGLRFLYPEELGENLDEKTKNLYSFFRFCYQFISESIMLKDIENSYSVFMQGLPNMYTLCIKYKKFFNEKSSLKKLWKMWRDTNVEFPEDMGEFCSLKIVEILIEKYFHGDVEAFFDVLSLSSKLESSWLWFIATNIVLYQINNVDEKDVKIVVSCSLNYEKVITENLNSISKQFNQIAKMYKEQNDKLFEFRKTLENVEDGKCIPFPNSLEKVIFDDELSFSVLEYIFHHNFALDYELEMQYKNLKENSYHALLELFHIYSYDAFDLNKDKLDALLSKRKVKDIEVNLSFLAKYHYVQNDNFLYYLYLNNDTISFFDEMMQKGYFSLSYLDNYIKEISSDVFSFQKNVELLSLEVSPSKIKNSSLFLLDTNLLERMLQLSRIYQIDLKNVSLQFLANPNSFYNLDQWIELGEKDFIFSHTQYLKYDLLPMKLKLAKTLKINYSLDGKLEKNLTSLLGYIKEEDLYKSLMLLEEKEKSSFPFVKPCVYLHSIEEKLKPYEVDAFTYSYEGLLLSKYRILRILSSLVDTLVEGNEVQILNNALVLGTLYTEEEKNILRKLSLQLCLYEPSVKVKK